jgi:hypothetical protein
MELYRAYIIGDDGRVIGFDKIECRNASEAIRKASSRRRARRSLDGPQARDCPSERKAKRKIQTLLESSLSLPRMERGERAPRRAENIDGKPERIKFGASPRN